MIELLFDAAALAGVAAVGYGLFLAWAPLGWVYGGAAAVGAAFLGARVLVVRRLRQEEQASGPVRAESREDGGGDDEE